MVGASVPRLQYIDHDQRPMTSYTEWCNSRINEAYSIDRAFDFAVDDRDPLVDLVVNAQIYSSIYDSMMVYVNDIISEGYAVRVDTVRGWDAVALRGHFAALIDSELVGAVLIGNAPIAWYEMESAEGREEFPIDLYFMDLNGTWTDSDSNGLYDTHGGHKAPEIWIGRLYASSMTWGNETFLLNNYFSKIHRYRNSGYNIPQKALAYVDDDWYSFNNCNLNELYDTVVVVRAYNTTTAADFRSRLDDAYEWVQICSHSSPWGNTFKRSGGFAGTVFNFELWFANPPFLFVNLFQCSGTRFFEENFEGGCYIYGPTYGLLAIGSAKVGSMLHFDDFYGPLNSGISIGEAYKQWFTQWGITDPDWFYGMILCGDPLLRPLQSVYRPDPFYSRRKIDNPDLHWSTPEPVDSDLETDGFVSVTKDGQGRLWAAWVTGRSVPDGRTEICTSYRTGGTWTSATIVDPYEYWDFFPSMTTNSAGFPVVAWSRCFGRNYDVYVSTGTGSSWGTPYRVSSKATDALHPALTVDGDDRLWVTMERWNHLNGDIYCRYYQASAWQSMFAVTVDEGNDYKPSMATDSSGYAWTVWASERYQDNRNIYVKRYNPGAGQWADIYRITSNTSQDQDPRICVAGDNTIWVAWTTWRHGNTDIYASFNNGSGWSNAQPMTSDTCQDEHCTFAVDTDGYVWCFWQSDRTGDWEILANYYKDGVWQGISSVSNHNGRDIFPSAVLDDSGNVWVFWQSDRSGNWDIYCSRIFSDLIDPSVAVVYPNGGEILNIGESDTIRWIATDNQSVDSVSIYYSTNNGSNWFLIASGEPNDSQYVWDIPPTPSTQCLVRLVAYDAFPNSSQDESDAMFTIRDAEAPQVTVLHPNGGEVFSAGQIDTLRWSASDNIGIDSLFFEFSSDNGAQWQYISDLPITDSVFDWTIPDVHSTECLVRVRAYDAGLNVGEDESDSVFTIMDEVAPQVQVLVPNGGEIWYWNNVETIEWQSTDNAGIDSIDVYLSLDGGSTYPIMIAHIDGNDSIYDWTIPETTSYECLIRITGYDVAGNSAFDISDSLFTIGDVGVEEQLGLPTALAMNFMSSNPYRSDLVLRLQIPELMPVTVSVFDVKGCLVENLIKGELKRGYYTINWSNPNIAAGIYFVRISAGDIEKTEKVVKIK